MRCFDQTAIFRHIHLLSALGEQNISMMAMESTRSSSRKVSSRRLYFICGARASRKPSSRCQRFHLFRDTHAPWVGLTDKIRQDTGGVFRYGLNWPVVVSLPVRLSNFKRSTLLMKVAAATSTPGTSRSCGATFNFRNSILLGNQILPEGIRPCFFDLWHVLADGK